MWWCRRASGEAGAGVIRIRVCSFHCGCTNTLLLSMCVLLSLHVNHTLFASVAMMHLNHRSRICHVIDRSQCKHNDVVYVCFVASACQTHLVRFRCYNAYESSIQNTSCNVLSPNRILAWWLDAAQLCLFGLHCLAFMQIEHSGWGWGWCDHTGTPRAWTWSLYRAPTSALCMKRHREQSGTPKSSIT